MQEYKKPKAKVISPTNRGTTGMIKAPKRRRWTGRAVAKKRMDEMKRHKHDHSPACAEKFAERIEGDIKRAVPHIVAVMGDGAHLPFAYTIGNTSKDLPELLMIGYHDAGAIGSVLGKLSDAMIEREHAFADGETVNLGGKYPVKIIDANATAQDKYTYRVILWRLERLDPQTSCRNDFAVAVDRFGSMAGEIAAQAGAALTL